MISPSRRLQHGKVITDRQPFGAAYRLDANGEFRELWRTQGWCSFKAYLANDGRHLVRFGDWGRDQSNHTDLAVAFYDRGKLLKQYQVKDLIKDPDRIVISVSHYQWRAARQSRPNGFEENAFHLVMIDKTTYQFDIATGEIRESGVDQDALSSRDIRQAEEATAKQKGQQLLEKWNQRAAYEELFKLSDAEAVPGLISGVYFDGPEWQVTLTPKEPLQHGCLVEAVFPTADNACLRTSITPKEIHTALEKGFEHPFVAQRFTKSGATGIRLRIAGERLHWNTPELQEFWKKLTGHEMDAGDLRKWAYIIIDAKEPRFTSAYLNIETGELIYEDESKWPWEPILLDRSGTVVNSKTKSVPSASQ